MDYQVLKPATPQEMLAWDDAFLDAAEQGDGTEQLWFWESSQPFVVVGYGQSLDREVNLDACSLAGIPVFRRCSGGGAVVQGPGCLCYGLILRIDASGPNATIASTNAHVMERHREAIASLVTETVVIRGHTDLAIQTPEGELKFSGNAQRRRRSFLLFHGTLLLDFDLSLIEHCLRFPSLAPEYRAGRSHGSFVVNLRIPSARIIQAICNAWGATQVASNRPLDAMKSMLNARYSNPDWHSKR